VGAAFSELGVQDAVDVTVVAVLLFIAILGLRRSGAAVAVVGFGVLGAVYWTAQRFDLVLTERILQAFFAVFVIVLVVVFQEDLRRLVERIGVWGLRRKAPHTPDSAVDALVRSVTQLVRTRRGALIVIPGREPLDRHIEGGVAIDARTTEPLLLSLFDPNSPGHDGAVLMRGDRVDRFAVHLPLSEDRAQLGAGGTRHAAALGLAEVCDALVVVVSEERATVSLAHDGRIRLLSGPDALVEELRGFAAATAPAPVGVTRALLRRWPEALMASAGAAILWLVFVAGSGLVEVARPAAVVVDNLPEGWVLESVEPEEVQALVEGPRRDLYLAGDDELSVHVDALLVQLGRRTFTLSEEAVNHPPGLRILGLEPERVRLSVTRSEGAEEGG
jgi:uncharacterized protein (TIGR00159 family)